MPPQAGGPPACEGSAPSSPSYSTPTFQSSQPISMRPTWSANRSNTSICVRCGRKPAAVRTRRVRVSCGDSAPASTSPMASRSWTMPRDPLWRSIRMSTSTVLTSVACIRASRRMTANVTPYRRPSSNAVRAAVVTGMPRIKDIRRRPAHRCARRCRRSCLVTAG